MGNKYFKVICKCGHVGRGHFVRVSFPITAQCASDAADVARYIPRVKHDQKDAILDCVEIDEAEFLAVKKANSEDPYLRCSNPQEQRCIEDFSSRIENEPSFFAKRVKMEKEKSKNAAYKIKKQKEIDDCLREEMLESVQGGIDYELLAY
mgnify:FL=1